MYKMCAPDLNTTVHTVVCETHVAHCGLRDSLVDLLVVVDDIVEDERAVVEGALHGELHRERVELWNNNVRLKKPHKVFVSIWCH